MSKPRIAPAPAAEPEPEMVAVTREEYRVISDISGALEELAGIARNSEARPFPYHIVKILDAHLFSAREGIENRNHHVLQLPAE
jgi:hypothetical protein